tara:strand:+ start:254 stop:517 length:264 start_codon:yes stop_codon:yes gene_type:complete
MTLSPETNYTFFLKNPSLMYCEAHDCLRVAEDFQDSVCIEGISRDEMNTFIERYFEYVLEQSKSSKLVKAFKEATQKETKTASTAAS